MNLRAWILVLALTCFAAGTGAGLLLALRLRPARPADRPFADYEKLFRQSFELEPERQAAFHDLLRAYERDLERVRREHLAAYRSSMESDLLKLGRDYGELVRDLVLPASQRERYDELAAGLPFPETP